MLRLSVIVPATDGPSTLPRCIAAIRRADDPPEEVIVIQEPPRASPAEARNRGASQATGDILVFVDADVLVHRDAFTRLRAAFDADPGLAAFFGSYDDTPEAPGRVSVFRNLLHHHVHQSSPGPAGTFWAGLGAIRRDAFDSVGGFDAVRFTAPSMEDVELGMRLAATGARIELDPLLQGTHLKAWTLASMVRTDFTARGIPWVTLLLERGSPSSALNLGWRHRLSTLAAVLGLVALLTGRRGGVGAAALALVALNGSFYALLARRQGPLAAAGGVGLHAVHLLTGAAAVPAGAIAFVRNGGRAPGRQHRERACDGLDYHDSGSSI